MLLVGIKSRLFIDYALFQEIPSQIQPELPAECGRYRELAVYKEFLKMYPSIAKEEAERDKSKTSGEPSLLDIDDETQLEEETTDKKSNITTPILQSSVIDVTTLNPTITFASLLTKQEKRPFFETVSTPLTQHIAKMKLNSHLMSDGRKERLEKKEQKRREKNERKEKERRERKRDRELQKREKERLENIKRRAEQSKSKNLVDGGNVQAQRPMRILSRKPEAVKEVEESKRVDGNISQVEEQVKINYNTAPRIPYTQPKDMKYKERTPYIPPKELEYKERTPYISPKDSEYKERTPYMTPKDTEYKQRTPYIPPKNTEYKERTPYIPPQSTNNTNTANIATTNSNAATKLQEPAVEISEVKQQSPSTTITTPLVKKFTLKSKQQAQPQPQQQHQQQQISSPVVQSQSSHHLLNAETNTHSSPLPSDYDPVKNDEKSSKKSNLNKKKTMMMMDKEPSIKKQLNSAKNQKTTTPTAESTIPIPAVSTSTTSTTAVPPVVVKKVFTSASRKKELSNTNTCVNEK